MKLKQEMKGMLEVINLNNYINKKDDQQFFVLLKWGKERSVIEEVNSHKVYLINNDYLMSLDERGIII